MFKVLCNYLSRCLETEKFNVPPWATLNLDMSHLINAKRGSCVILGKILIMVFLNLIMIIKTVLLNHKSLEPMLNNVSEVQ